MAYDPQKDDVIVYPLIRVSDMEFEELAGQSDETREMIGYPYVITYDGRVWPNPPSGVEIHATEGSWLKPFFLVGR